MSDSRSIYLDADRLSRALISGIHLVVADQIFLNKINVFPVADGDTGTNLSLSLGATLEVLQAPDNEHVGSMLASVADALLDGARGNSGAIMAQFFQGVSDSASELTQFSTTSFSQAIRTGSEYAHDALSNPEEGTILSVIAAFAESIEQQLATSKNSDFNDIFKAAVLSLEQALAATTGQLDVLRKADVVDAGAKGFVDLVDGMSTFILHGKIVDKPDLSVLRLSEFSSMPKTDTADYAYRYCTECIVTGPEIDRRKLRESLAELGESLVLAGSKRKAKIHIHVNDPQAVFDVGRQYGDVSAEKADDLQRQQHGDRDNKRGFAVITDSAADIADADMERLDIHMVPCRIQFGNRGYLDKVSITTEEFYQQLAENPLHPTTSQPAPGDFRRQFQYLASHYPDVVSINLTGTASGTLEAARSAANRSDAPGRMHIINSLNVSLGQGLLTVFAAECAVAGLPVDRTIAAVRSLIPRTHTYAVLSNLDYAVRGGRIPRWVKIAAAWTRLTPIIRTTATGKIAPNGCIVGSRNLIAKFARHVASRIRGDKAIVVAVGHALSPDGAAELERVLRQDAPNITRLSVAELGTALGVHGGPGTLVIATQPFVTPADFAG